MQFRSWCVKCEQTAPSCLSGLCSSFVWLSQIDRMSQITLAPLRWGEGPRCTFHGADGHVCIQFSFENRCHRDFFFCFVWKITR